MLRIKSIILDKIDQSDWKIDKYRFLTTNPIQSTNFIDCYRMLSIIDCPGRVSKCFGSDFPGFGSNFVLFLNETDGLSKWAPTWFYKRRCWFFRWNFFCRLDFRRSLESGLCSSPGSWKNPQALFQLRHLAPPVLNTCAKALGTRLPPFALQGLSSYLQFWIYFGISNHWRLWRRRKGKLRGWTWKQSINLSMYTTCEREG